MIDGFQLLFLSVLFLVSFFSDIVLNDLSRFPLTTLHSSSILKSLTPYFKSKSIIQSGIYAGLTVVVAYGLLMVLSFGKYPLREVMGKDRGFTKYTSISYELFFAFILGYCVDFLIYKFNIFGTSLHHYYNIAGAGLWGAIAFVFAIVITYAVLFFFINPFLRTELIQRF